jgi:hypothetical protein
LRGKLSFVGESMSLSPILRSAAVRLSDVLSKAPDNAEGQVEGFLGTRRLSWGRHRTICVGKIALNFFCRGCSNIRTFMSGDELSCLATSERSISIDASLRCPVCEASVEAWFLVACDEDLYAQAPVVYLERYIENRRDSANRVGVGTGQFVDLLERAQSAYENHLGAGSMIYLRKIFETITMQVANVAGISTTTSRGRRKPFRGLLEEVDQQHHIIPDRFSQNGYMLFSELSAVIHGDSDEVDALQKYGPCRQLIIGVVDKVSSDQEMARAIHALGWDVAQLSEITGGEVAP